MRSTFKTVFYVNGSKEKNGIVLIIGRVTINGTITQFFSCKQGIYQIKFCIFVAVQTKECKYEPNKRNIGG